MTEFTVVVEAKLPPGTSRDGALSLVTEDTHVEQDGSTGAALVRRYVERLEADNAASAATRVEREFREFIAEADVPDPVTWQVSSQPYYEPPWWQHSGFFFGTRVDES